MAFVFRMNRVLSLLFIWFLDYHHGERNWNSHRYKEDQTQKISKSIFVTNFPDHILARDLWGTCKAYGTVVDVYIPYKKSKAGKRFAFVRFIKRNVGISSDSFKGNVGNYSNSFASVLKSGKPVTEATRREVLSLVLDDTCFSDRDFNLSLLGKVKDITALPNLYVILEEEVIIQGNVHWVRAKEMERWDPLLRNEDYASSSSDEENEQENEGSRNEEKYESDKEVAKVSESSCGSIIDLMDELVKVGQTMGYNMDGCVKNIETIIGSQGDHNNRVNFVSLQETKMEHIELVTINKLWGNSSYDYAFSYSLGGSSEVILNDRSILFKELNDIISMDLEEMAQKAKVCWAIEGDENSKLVSHRICLADVFNNQLSLEQQDELERTVSIEEINRAVWDCGTNKSPGPDEVETAARYIGYPTFVALFSHLGVKVGGRMKRINSWDDVVSKVTSQLSKWKLKTLSIGGRLTLIKSVLTSIPLYQMSSFKVPTKVLNILESIKRKFFNGIEGNERKLSLISWDTVLALKKYGEPLKLYMVRKEILEPMVTLLDALLALISFERSMSFVPKVSIFLSFIRKKVGNGEDTLFWEDSWFDGISLKQQFSRLYSLESAKHINVAEKMNHPSLSWSYRREPRGGIEEEQQNMFFSRISSVILPNMRDRWIWSFEALGDFSVTSARHLIDDYLLPNGDVQTRWVKVVPIKINVFTWRVRLDKLLTRLNLSLRGV
nr:hypothetical protein [Tanacetum cinerariifolium]